MPYKDKEKRKTYLREYYTEHKDENREWRKGYREKEIVVRAIARRKRRLKVLTHYSGGEPHCACCGEKALEFLCIDHINGGGIKHRAELGFKGGGSQFYSWLIKENFPMDYRVLCHNCNMALGFYGYCPHTKQ